jgi:hypothetical protein
MMEQTSERYSMIHLFENFIHSLGTLVVKDQYLLTQPSSNRALAFRLAIYLEQELEKLLQEGYFVDMGIPLSNVAKKIVPDILIHNREDEPSDVLLSVVTRNGYLSEKELLSLNTLKTSTQANLTLAIAILPQQEYLLIYRIDEDFVDYYHFYVQDKHCSFLKRREIGELEIDEKQLTLSISSKRKSSRLRRSF